MKLMGSHWREGLREFGKRARKILKDVKGVSTSLVEAGATIAIGTTLAAALVPTALDKNDDAKIAKAVSEVQSIKSVIANFKNDTTEYPVRATVDSPVSIPIGEGESAVTILRTGDLAGSGAKSTTFGGQVRDPAIKDGVSVTTDTAGNLNDHVVVDTFSYGPERNWKGPYSETIRTDPWGNNYVIYAKGFYTAPTRGSGSSGVITDRFVAWVLSAGPNGLLETSDEDTQLKGDDIGVVAASINPTAKEFAVGGGGS